MQRSIRRTWQPAGKDQQFSIWFNNLLKTYKMQRHFRKGGQLHSVGVLGIRKWILAQNLPGNQQALRNMLIDAMASANLSCPGSDVWIPAALSDELTILNQKYASSAEYEDVVASMTHNEEAIELFRTTVSLCGPLTKVSTRIGQYTEPFVRYKSSYSFPIHPCQMFTNTLGKYKDIELANPEVFMIEGAPSTIGEIEPLLQRNIESKRPIVIVARHFPEEISATLATNFRTGKLKVIPLVYGSDVNTVNMAADLMAVCGGELVSTHFGDVISASCSNDDKYGFVNRLEITESGVEIDSDADTTRQIKYLIQKMAELDDDEEPVKELLGNRIHSLTNDSIVVHIPKKSPELHEELDAMLKHYISFVQYGMALTQWGWLPSIYVKTANTIAKSVNHELSRIGGYLLEVK